MQSQIVPDYLKPGDKVAIVAPARYITPQETTNFKQWAIGQGWEVVDSPNLFGLHHQFSGTAEERFADLKWAIESKEIKAIFAARGGYGSIQLVEYLKQIDIRENPKWLVGFSDISTLHFYFQQLGISSIHGPMVAQFNQSHNFIDNNRMSLLKVLTGMPQKIHVEENIGETAKNFEGILFGGNLSLLYAYAAAGGKIPYSNAVLFLEDLDEYLYHIDRMMTAMKLGGFFNSLNGVIVGSLTEMNDNTVPFGRNAKEIIQKHFNELNIPVIFNFSAGHSNENNSLKLGMYCTFESHNFIQF